MRRLLRRWADEKLREENRVLQVNSAMRGRIVRNLAAKHAEERKAWRTELEEAVARAERAEALLREARDGT